VIALLGLDVLDYPVDAGVAFERGGVQHQAVADVAEAGEPVIGILQGDPADNTVDLVTLGEEEFREVGAVLARNPCDQSAFEGHW
jgi:hypothetical protein